jgi:heat shock protein HtpX
VIDGSLFRLLTAAELEAIVAHELSHLKGRDSLVKTLGYSLVRTATGLVWFVFLPVALLVGGVARAVALLRDDDPVAVRRRIRTADAMVTGMVVVCLFLLTAVVQAYSRRREYAADDRAARATDPLALARALENNRARDDARRSPVDAGHPRRRGGAAHRPASVASADGRAHRAVATGGAKRLP